MNMYPSYFNADQMQQLRLALDDEDDVLEALFRLVQNDDYRIVLHWRVENLLEGHGVKDYDVRQYLLNNRYAQLGYLKRRGANYVLATVGEIAKKALEGMK